MKRTGVRFSERMAGTVAAVDEATTRTRAVMRGTVSIADLDDFFDDPNHAGRLEGSVRIDALSSDWLAATGGVRLFSMGRRPGERLMEYRMEFELDGVRHALAGTKYVFDDPVFDVWRDVTTLHTSVIRYGPDGEGTPVSSGILRLSFLQSVLMFMTLRGTGEGGFFTRLGAAARFSLFFVGEVVERFLPLAQRRQPAAK
jgi:hypothetical protein